MIDPAQPGVLLTLFSFAVVIGLVVFVHEFGHYLAGRIFGVKADVFSIGFGRELLGWTDRRGTRWKVSVLPLGGYVKFAGDMSPASQADPAWLSLPAEERKRTFQAKALWQKAIIVFAGPAINFIFAIVIFAGFFQAYGIPETPTRIEQVIEGTAAARAGLKPGDTILSIDGQNTRVFEDIARVVAIHPGERVIVRLRRDGRLYDQPIRLDSFEEVDRFGNRNRIGRLGISPGAQIITDKPLPQTIVAATVRTGQLVSVMITAIEQVVTGRRPVEELGGPIKIAQFAGQTATLGWQPLVQFMAFISINLGFINLLPVPMLDGGHLLFYAIEAVRRRPIKPKAQQWAFMSGLAVLVSLMVFVTINDLGSLGLWEKLAKLAG